MRKIGIWLINVGVIGFLLTILLACSFQPEFYTVTFDTCGGSPIEQQIVQKHNTAEWPSDCPFKDGYVFANWYTEKSYENIYNFSRPITENITLYAKWLREEHAVYFYADGDSYTEIQFVEHNDLLDRPDDPIKQGHLFLGWKINADILAPCFDFNTIITSPLALFAAWATIPWQFDEADHWYDFYVNDNRYKKDKSPHSFHAISDETKESNWIKCSDCGYETIEEKHEHVWNSGTVIKPPTCTETGIKIFRCEFCSLEKTESIPITSHTFVDGICQCGLIQIDSFIEIDDYGLIWLSDTFPRSYSLDLILPETVQGKQILSIAAGCFSVCPNVTKIDIPDGVTTISDSAFNGCNALQTVRLGSSVANFSAYNLWGTCTNLQSIEVSDSNNDYSSRDGILFSKDATKLIYCPVQNGISDYVVPNSVVTIQANAFRNNKTITKLNPSSNLEKIESYAFASSSQLTEVNFPEGLVSIAGQAFNNCQKLKTINLPSTLTSIGSSAFSHITNATIAEGATKIPNYAFYGSKYLKTVTIPESVTSIGSYSFYNTSLVGIHLPNSITEIKDYAFYGCASLRDINIPLMLESIGNGAFQGCGEIRGSLELPIGLQTIGTSAFSGCINISNLVIPSSVKSLGHTVFSNWAPTQKIHVYSSFENGTATSLSGHYDAWRSSHASVYVDLTDCGSSVIGKGAFSGCNFVLDPVIPEGIETIEEDAFYTSKFKIIRIPQTVSTIGNNAFNRCPEAEAIIVDNENSNYTSLDGVLYNKAKTVLISYPGSKSTEELTIPEGVERISSFAFIGCSKLKTITLPLSMKQVEMGAFGYSSIRKLILKRDIKPLTNVSFYLASTIQEILVPQSVVSDYINHRSFKDMASRITGY